MFNLRTSTVIEAPINRVFDYMSTPKNNSQWQYGTLVAATIISRVNKKGVYFRSIGHFLGHRNLGTYQVIESDLSRIYRFKSLSGPLHLHTAYTFDTLGEGTKVTISIHVGTIDFFDINERELEKGMEKQLKKNLILLKTLLEVRQFPTTSKTEVLVI